ncbi:MAG: PD40 domain-containing protein [Melioribacteraceae bacterium]|nr:PD40 domain-containing protein [Melioribacteraceae bacterium]
MFTLIFSAVLLSACSTEKKYSYDPLADSLRFTGEVHLRNIKQLTFGGNNAEAYFCFDNKKLVFQSDWDKINDQSCDQIFVMNADGSPYSVNLQYQLVSTGKGRTTCSYFLKDGRIVYASTHEGNPDCPEAVMFKDGKYVWPIYSSYDIYVTDENGVKTEKLIGGQGYDAEATASPDGKFIVFTSTRSGDLELYRYEIATGEIIQLTDELGYDGGAFFSKDSKMIVWRASRPQGDEADVYKKLLNQGLVEPKELNVFVADIEGKNVRQVTDLSGANWAPFFHPDGKKILFCSNHHSQKQGGRLFDIFMINLDGTGLEQITHSGTFDAFPMFSFDGTKLVFASNRRTDRQDSRETNIFTADWIETPEDADLRFKSLN